MRRNSPQSTVPGRQPQITRWRIGSLVFAIIAVIACGWFAIVNWLPKPPAKPDPTWARIVDTGVFRVGIDPSFPPFESDDSKGQLHGMDIALVDEIVREWSNANATPIQVEYFYTGLTDCTMHSKPGNSMRLFPRCRTTRSEPRTSAFRIPTLTAVR